MFFIKTEFTGLPAAMAKGAGTTTKLMRVWLEEAYTATLLHWHKEIRPKHFQESAVSEYGYRARGADYIEGKRALKGHTRPLVYSGESQRATEQFSIRATSKGGVLAMSPGNLAFSVKGKVNKREELTSMTVADGEELARVFGRSMEMQIRAWPGRHTTG